jgi:hypothetical protein
MKILKRAFLFTLITSSTSVLFSQNSKKMNSILNEKKDFTPVASASSSQNDFDFLVGTWNIHNKQLKSRLTNSNEWIEFDATHEMRKVLTGFGNVENICAIVNGSMYEGMAIRLFNPATKLWSIYWADNKSVTMDNPVVGSFENNIGIFYGKEMFKGNEVILKFKWDATDIERPVWSQSFSADDGKTWEWNWYMYFSRRANDVMQNLNANHNIKVIELRDYLIKPGRRDEFINYFEENFIKSQNVLGGYTLGQYRVKGADDNFFWIRGFSDMAARNKFLNDFYYGPFWKSHKTLPNSLLLNNDNVHLLKPLNLNDSPHDADYSFSTNWFGLTKGIAVVDFYISNTKLNKLIEFVKATYVSIIHDAGAINTSFWISEEKPNDFPALPVFQDKNLLVQITFYKDELEYESKIKLIAAKMNEEQKTNFADLVTIKNTLIIYPTDKSFLISNE